MKKSLVAISFVIVVLVGVYAARVGSAARAPATAAVILPVQSPPVAPAVAEPRAAPFPKRVASATPGQEFDPLQKYPPGTYVPRGFMPDFRKHIVADFNELIDQRLGKDFPVEKRQQIAAAQNALWDEHGPNADLFRMGRISQQEFAERTHEAFGAYVSQLGQILSDDEYEKVLNLKKGEDPYAALFHTSGEQPGLRFQNGANPTAENEPRAAAPGPSLPPAPHPSAADYSSSEPAAGPVGSGKYNH